MANPIFPTLANKPDSSQFSVEYEDPSLRTSTEGGYVLSRPRHSRPPRATFSVSYTDIPEADVLLIRDFYRDTVKGGSLVFDWTSPEDGAIYAVRFKGVLKREYKGIGAYKKWNCSFELEQA